MVRHYFPQVNSSQISFNTNNPPQGLLESGGGPPAFINMLFEDGVTMEYEQNTDDMEYE